MSDALVRILDGNTFVVSDERGDIEASPTDPTGLFSFDTRFLSRWVLTVDGERLNRALGRRSAVLRDALLPRPGDGHRLRRLEAVGHPAARRRRRLPRGADHPEPRREPGRPDRADRGGVRLRRPVRGQGRAREEGDVLLDGSRRHACVLGYERETLPARDDDLGDRSGRARRARADVRGRDRAARRVDDRSCSVVTAMVGQAGTPRAPEVRPGAEAGASAHGGRASRSGCDGAPRLECDCRARSRPTYRRSLVDLAALRFSPPVAGGRSLPAAGLPWFMTMFGRDSIFTSLQALPFTPELAADDARARSGSGRAAGSTTSATRIPARSSTRCATARLTAFEERPHSPYYGCADATPLFVVLLDEYERWTGDRSSSASSSPRRAPR